MREKTCSFYLFYSKNASIMNNRGWWTCNDILVQYRTYIHTKMMTKSRRDRAAFASCLFFLTDWNKRECSIIADVNPCACACLLVAWNRQSSSLQDSEYSKENANTAWKFGQGESRVSIRVCAYVCVHAHFGTCIPHICLYSAVGCLWGNCGVFGEIRDAVTAISATDSVSPPFSVSLAY